MSSSVRKYTENLLCARQVLLALKPDRLNSNHRENVKRKWKTIRHLRGSVVLSGDASLRPFSSTHWAWFEAGHFTSDGSFPHLKSDGVQMNSRSSSSHAAFSGGKARNWNSFSELRPLPSDLQVSGAHPEFFQPEPWIILFSPPAPQLPSWGSSVLLSPPTSPPPGALVHPVEPARQRRLHSIFFVGLHSLKNLIGLAYCLWSPGGSRHRNTVLNQLVWIKSRRWS